MFLQRHDHPDGRMQFVQHEYPIAKSYAAHMVFVHMYYPYAMHMASIYAADVALVTM